MSLLRRHGMFSISEAVDAILVTMTPTAGYTVGFNLTFTGSVFIDFKDGGGKEALTSGVEKTHLYASASTYIAEITGDLTNITAFNADNNRITKIENIITGLITGNFDISNNLYNAPLDLTNSPQGGNFYLYTNTKFDSVTFAPTGNQPIAINFNNANIFGTLNLPPVKTQVLISGCANLVAINFATSGNLSITTFTIVGNSLITTVDLSNLTFTGLFSFRNHNSLATITLGAKLLNAAIYINALTYTDFTACSMAANNITLNYNVNDSTNADINQMLVELYALVSGEGVGGDYTGRTIFMGGAGMGAPDGTSGGYDGTTAKANLIAKGITVSTN